MAERIADVLLIVMPVGTTLTALRREGVLEREWALWHALQESYGRIVILSTGDATEHEALREVAGEAIDASIFVVSIAPHQSVAGEARHESVALILEAMGGARKAVVRTIELASSDFAVPLVGALRGAGVQVALIARGGSLWTRFVAHEHGPGSPAAASAAQREGELCKHADVVIGTTQTMVDDLAWRYGLDPSRCRVVPNYVLVDHPGMAPVDREKGLVLTLGPLIPRKRVHLLIEAIAQLNDDTNTPHLEVIGDGPERPRLQALATTLRAPVTFRGRVSYTQILQRMSQCAIYLQASALEGHPRSVLESMACGATVIVADAPGMESVLKQGVTGLRAAAEPAAFSHAIREALADDDWREVLGASAARLTQANYGLPMVLVDEVSAHQRAIEVSLQRISRRTQFRAA